MRHDIARALAAAYGDLRFPSYRFAIERHRAGLHQEVVQQLATRFDLDDQTSLGSDDVCITLHVRPRHSTDGFRWQVQLSLLGNYAVVSSLGDADVPWPLMVANDGSDDAALLRLLRNAHMDLLPHAELSAPTPLRPPNAGPTEVYTVYNALFSDMTPYPTGAQGEAPRGAPVK